MARPFPIAIEILTCFVLSILLYQRYGDMVKNNVMTVIGVSVGWFFSFMVITLLPADLTSTAYRQCLFDLQSNINSSTTPAPIVNSTTAFTSPTINITPISQHQNISTSIASNHDYSLDNVADSCHLPWNYVSDDVLIKLWRFIYWTSQFLTWLFLPMMQSYSMSGDFTTVDKLKSSARATLIYYSSLGAIFTVLLIYVIIRENINFQNLKLIVISSSNTWGLFLLVVLLGYGLVELPKFLLNSSRHSQLLSRQYFRVAKVNAEKCEAEEKLDDALEEIHQAFATIGNNEHNLMKKYLNQIVDKCPTDWKRRSNAFRRQAAASNSAYEPDRSKVQEHDIKTMIRLNKKVIRAVHYHRQINCKWNQLIKEVIGWEDVVRNQTENPGSHSNRVFISTLPKERSIVHNLYTPQVEWYWKCLIRVLLFRMAGYIVAAVSLTVVLSFPMSFLYPNLSIYALVVKILQSHQQYFYLELFSLLSIGYLAVCAFYTVFNMKIYNVYYLAQNQQTDEYSLIFSGMLVCRLAAPLCLNYLCLVSRDSHIVKQASILETSFTKIMGHLDLIPIMNIFLPFCISAICLAIYFNLQLKVLHYFGFEQFIENDEMTIDWVQTGRELVKREKSKLLRNYESSTVSYNAMVAPASQPKTDDFTTMDRPNDSNGDSPTSLASSSSGLSRSSLLLQSSKNTAKL